MFATVDLRAMRSLRALEHAPFVGKELPSHCRKEPHVAGFQQPSVRSRAGLWRMQATRQAHSVHLGGHEAISQRIRQRDPASAPAHLQVPGDVVHWHTRDGHGAARAALPHCFALHTGSRPGECGPSKQILCEVWRTVRSAQLVHRKPCARPSACMHATADATSRRIRSFGTSPHRSRGGPSSPSESATAKLRPLQTSWTIQNWSPASPASPRRSSARTPAA